MGAALDYYYNKSKIWLPMKAENHDPTNPGAARTLDVSGNGNHALLGDGTTLATMPTKLQKRGYDFGSTDYLNLGDLALFNSTTAFTLTSIIRNRRLTGSQYYMGKVVDVNNQFRVRFYFPGPLMLISLGAGTNARLTVNSPNFQALDTCIFSITYNGLLGRGEKLKVYVNGSRQPTAVVSAIPAQTADLSGVDFILESSFTGQYLHTSAHSITLTAPQVQDLHKQLLAEVNHV